MKLECAKTKNSAAFEPVYTARLPHAESCVRVPSDRAPQANAGSKSDTVEMDILERLNYAIFADCGLQTPRLRELFDKEVGAATLYRKLNYLYSKGYVERQGSSLYTYRITTAGTDALRAYRPFVVTAYAKLCLRLPCREESVPRLNAGRNGFLMLYHG